MGRWFFSEIARFRPTFRLKISEIILMDRKIKRNADVNSLYPEKIQIQNS